MLVCEQNAETAKAGRERILSSLERAVRKGKITAQERERAAWRLRFTTDLGEFDDRQLVVEAVVENEAVKTEVFATLDKVVADPDAILASNTSAIPIMKLGMATERAANVIGLHFFNPVPVLPLVEVVTSLLTGTATRDRAEAFVTRVLDKKIIRATDRAGFVVNALRAVTAAIGALKGPLHGGANEAVMAIFDEIGPADNAESWLNKALADKRKIMGFGHRVYKRGDSRVPTMRAALHTVADLRDGQRLIDLYEALADAMYAAKGLHPNLDYPAGPAYHLMGFDTPVFTPIFVAARITGWTAHINEQLAGNSLIRPSSTYTGKPQRELPRP